LVDFYYSRERDFVVAWWSRDWPRRLTANWINVADEVNLAVNYQAGADALRWFLTCPGNEAILIALTRGFHDLSPDAKSLILNAVGEIGSSERGVDPVDVLEQTHALSDPVRSVQVAAAKLLSFHEDDEEPLAEFMANHYDNVANCRGELR
jgi:hypothetical protein